MYVYNILLRIEVKKCRAPVTQLIKSTPYQLPGMIRTQFIYHIKLLDKFKLSQVLIYRTHRCP